MDEHAMTQGVIPVRHSSLPGIVKLPRRFEKAALGDSRTAKHRKISICAGPQQMGETLFDRLNDLMTAIMWIKQELVLLRQHDILLKRQFFNIHDSIQSLQPRTIQTSSPSLLSSNVNMSGYYTFPSPKDTQNSLHPASPVHIRVTPDLSLPASILHYQLETFPVRPSASVSLLNTENENSDDTDGEDTFEDGYYRPRTSSMRTSRDLAALARRRGSKELI